jgi:hypothetical protein
VRWCMDAGSNVSFVTDRVSGPGYHAMNLERQHEPILIGSDDHLRFLHLLQQGSNDYWGRRRTSPNHS